MSITPRPLRVLLIHDTDFKPDDRAILGTSALSVCRIEFQDVGLTAVQIRSWSAFLEVIQSLAGRYRDHSVEMDVPDLLLIDCHFEDDTGSPPLKLANERDPLLAKRIVDARGLLYGALLVSYYLGQFPQRPIGFAIYSQDIKAAAPDPYAQTFFSILDALSTADGVHGLSPARVQKRMEEVGNGKTPDVVIPIALQSYRASLETCFRECLYPILSSFETAASLFSSILEHGHPRDDDGSGVGWLTFGFQHECVLLSSLFADCLDAANRWVPEKIKEVGAIQFIERIVEEGNPTREILNPVMIRIRQIEEGEEPSWASGLLGYKHKTLAFFILWAQDRCTCKWKPSKTARTVTDLNVLMGLHNKEMNRALGAVLGSFDPSRSQSEASYPASELLKLLDADNSIWPFPRPAWLLPLVRSYLKREEGQPGKEFVAREYWPKCLEQSGFE